MRRWRSSLLLAVVAVAAFAQQPGAMVTADAHKSAVVRRVGERLKCLCGCPMTVASCDMPGCGHALPARDRIIAMAAKGTSDDDIIASFVKEEGVRALAAPPVQGFYSLGYAMPALAVVFGLFAIAMFVRKFSHRPLAVAGGAPVAASPDVLGRYRDRIERETSDLD